MANEGLSARKLTRKSTTISDFRWRRLQAAAIAHTGLDITFPASAPSA